MVWFLVAFIFESSVFVASFESTFQSSISIYVLTPSCGAILFEIMCIFLALVGLIYRAVSRISIGALSLRKRRFSNSYQNRLQIRFCEFLSCPHIREFNLPSPQADCSSADAFHCHPVHTVRRVKNLENECRFPVR